jgi:lipopolysaccharide export system protein LptA
LELFLQQQPRDTLRTAIFTGDVHVEQAGKQPMQGDAGRVVMDFTGKNLVSKVHAEENVKLLQHQPASSPSASAQDLELTAPMVDFFLAAGRHLDRAETLGSGPQIAIRPTGTNTVQQTLITAAKFNARFDALGQLSSVHGAPDARIVTNTAGQPDRVSTSQTLDATFRPGQGIESILQQGNVAYVDGDRRAWADRARYTPADQMLVMTGSPRVIEGGMTTTSRTMRVNRGTGDAFADGDVKSTYSDLKPQPGGALLASSTPIHVTARSMTAHRTPAVALYTGDARLWQDANIVEAPWIQFDRDHRSVVAQESPGLPVSTVLVQTGKDGKTTPITITSARLTYTDSERKAHFERGVRAEGSDVTITAHEADVFLQPRSQATEGQTLAGPGRIDHMVAQGQVVVVQPMRRATGDRLVYTAASDQFVMTGGPPSIFDAERGKITGVSLTFFRHDDRVLVEGNDSSPTVTHTRVAR